MMGRVEGGGTVRSNSWHIGIGVTVVGVMLAILASGGSSAIAASCESLTSLSQPNTTITSAQSVPAGEFTLPSLDGSPAAGASPYSKLPAFCRVAVTLRPSSDSDIRIEVWLPVSGWNGKLQSVGNGGWAGFISYAALARGLADGYATASTDTGHTGNTGSFALGHPEKMIDFGYRSEHEMTCNQPYAHLFLVAVDRAGGALR
jgi:feruloyl esterase